MSNPERVKRIGELFDTMNSNPEDSPEYTQALHELDAILVGKLSMDIVKTVTEAKRNLGFTTKRKQESVMHQGKPAVAEYDVPDMPAAQLKCFCGEPVTTSCTDAVQASTGGWFQSKPRYGCPVHPVKPKIIWVDGDTMSAEEWEQQNAR